MLRASINHFSILSDLMQIHYVFAYLRPYCVFMKLLCEIIQWFLAANYCHKKAPSLILGRVPNTLHVLLGHILSF